MTEPTQNPLEKIASNPVSNISQKPASLRDWEAEIVFNDAYRGCLYLIVVILASIASGCAALSSVYK